jgi:hypothetical protein
LRDLVELTDQELTELTAKQRLRLVSAGVILAVCAALSLRSIVALFVDPTVPGLPGMSHPVGQVAWAAGLLAMLFAVTRLIRGVLRRRLQWALGISLLLHFLLCLSVSTVDFSGRDKQKADASGAELRRDEWSLPDYAMSEETDSEPAWMQPTDTETTENNNDAERMRAQIVQPAKQDVAEPVREQEPSEAMTPERQEHVAMANEAATELDRSEQLTELSPEPLKSVEMPEIRSPNNSKAEPELDAAEMQRADQALPQIERTNERSTVEQAVAMSESDLSAAVPEASRRDLSAELPEESEAEVSPRRDPAVRPASAIAEMRERLPNVETPSAPRATARESRIENARQQSQLAERRASSAMPRSQVADNRPQKAAVPRNEAAESTNAARANLADGGSAAMGRRSGAAPAAAGDTVEEVSVAQSAKRPSDLTRTSTASSAAASRSRSESSLPSERNDRLSDQVAASNGSNAPTAARVSSTNRRSTGDQRPVLGDTGDRAAGTPMNARSDRSGRSSDGSSVTSGLSVDVADASDVPTTRSAGRSRSSQASGEASRGTSANGSSTGSRDGTNDGDADGDAASSLISGPAVAGVGRRSSSLPTGRGTGSSGTSTGAAAMGASENDGDGDVISPVSSTIAGGREGSMSGRDANARLGTSDGFADGGGLLTLDRSGSGNGIDLSGLSAGTSGAEQSGELVMTGPQSSGGGGAESGSTPDDASGGQRRGGSGGSGGSGATKGSAITGLSGPRGTGVGRRLAGLPGSSGPSGLGAGGSGAGGLGAIGSGKSGGGGPQGSLVSAGSGDVSTARAALIGSPRRGAGADKPSVASNDPSITGLVKRSAGVTGGSATAAMPERLSLRTADGRREAATSLGGSKESEDAVERGLEWLATNQHPDGHWAIHDFPGDDDRNVGNFQSDTAATGLAMLAFLGAGYTHQSGKYQAVVQNGMQWLIARQKPDGDLFADTSQFVHFYSHGIAAIALCEAYGMTKDASLKEPSQQAIDFIVASQHPEFGGWRYLPRFESDTSVSGWQLMALKSGEVAGLKVPAKSYALVSGWLDSVERPGGQFSYHPTRDAGLAMTAEGLLMRQYLGAKRDDAKLAAGATFLRTRLPDFGERDAYYWYYATQVMFHMQGDYWKDWNNAMRDTLVNSQELTGNDRGSWDPSKPVPEKWASAGGRHYLTCLNLLMLEVYYRHLPLYEELAK